MTYCAATVAVTHTVKLKRFQLRPAACVINSASSLGQQVPLSFTPLSLACLCVQSVAVATAVLQICDCRYSRCHLAGLHTHKGKAGRQTYRSLNPEQHSVVCIVVAGALAEDPKLLLLDELTTFLDVEDQIGVLQAVKSITQQRRDVTAVWVTHRWDTLS